MIFSISFKYKDERLDANKTPQRAISASGMMTKRRQTLFKTKTKNNRFIFSTSGGTRCIAIEELRNRKKQKNIVPHCKAVVYTMFFVFPSGAKIYKFVPFPTLEHAT